MLRAEVAHLTCEQIARGGLRAVAWAPLWRDPMRYSGETEEAYSKRKSALRHAHLEAAGRAYSESIGNMETCKRAAAWLREGGDMGAALAVEAHIREQWR